MLRSVGCCCTVVNSPGRGRCTLFAGSWNPMKCTGLLLLAILLLVCPGWCDSAPQQQAQTLEVNTARSTRLSYLLFLPADYSRSQEKRWPLILYLHGGSLRGDVVERLRTVGLPNWLERTPDFPFVVVSPQCAAGEIWSDAEAAGALLDHIERDYRIDTDRVYVTGHSMGGRGALYFAYRMPARFAAVLALSPYSPITAWAGKLAHVPLWIFQGTADALAPLGETKELVGAIQADGGHPHFSVLEGRDHFILDVYDRSDVYEWLAQQRRGVSVVVP